MITVTTGHSFNESRSLVKKSHDKFYTAPNNQILFFFFCTFMMGSWEGERESKATSVYFLTEQIVDKLYFGTCKFSNISLWFCCLQFFSSILSELLGWLKKARGQELCWDCYNRRMGKYMKSRFYISIPRENEIVNL